MTLLLGGVTGGCVGIGALLVVAGVRGRAVLDVTRLLAGRLGRSVDRVLLRAALALAGAVGTIAVTHWAVLAVVAAGTCWRLPTWQRTRRGHAGEMALVEAIAVWTEQMRDTLAAANGLEHALATTAAVAPHPIAPAVQRLAARAEYERLPDALRRFADDVAHPMADFVVAALVVAAEKEARELGALLGSLADSARDEARMRSRVWVGRARSRTSVRIIIGVVVTFVAFLLAFDRDYLQPYDDAGGQFVLSIIAVTFMASFALMARMARITMPDRFIARRTAGGSP